MFASMRATLCGAGLCLAAPVVPAGSVSFQVVPLNPLDGGNVIVAMDINDAGVVSGTSGAATVGPGQHAVIWDGPEPQSFDSTFDISEGAVINDAGIIAGVGAFCPPMDGACLGLIARALPDGGFQSVGSFGGQWGAVVDINAAGSFVGWAYEKGFEQRAMLFTEKDGLINLGTLGGFASKSEAINDNGIVVGSSYTSDLHQRAFKWQQGVMSDLGTLGGDDSVALDINGKGTIVGWAHDARAQQRAFRLTSTGDMEDLQTLPQAVSSRAMVINDAGMIAGYWNDGRGQRVFRFSDEAGMVDLGVPGIEQFFGFFGPLAMNIHGDMAGTATGGIDKAVAWYWSESTGLTLLEQLVDDDMGISFDSVAGINDFGLLAVNGFNQAAILIPNRTTPDFDGDGFVGPSDLAQLLGAWGPCPARGNCPADIDSDGTVGPSDLAQLLGAWSTRP